MRYHLFIIIFIGLKILLTDETGEYINTEPAKLLNWRRLIQRITYSYSNYQWHSQARAHIFCP